MSDQENEQQQFNIQKIYLKDMSFESPNAPEVFQDGEWKPEVSVQLNTETKTLAEGVHEVILTVEVTAKHGDKTAFLVEVKQAGVFQMANIPNEQMGAMLGAYCPEILFPFVREAISDLVSKGGFPQLLLNPVNFNALYMQHLQQQQQEAAETAH
ncbi:MAG: protein-export chaperone SecB [Gammaproteobacteria bacterium]